MLSEKFMEVNPNLRTQLVKAWRIIIFFIINPLEWINKE